MIYEMTKECRVCGSGNLKPVVSVGPQALTGVFTEPNQEDPPSVELCLAMCQDCTMVQLDRSVDKDMMYRNYWYRSGTNQTMRDHHEGIAGAILELAGPKSDVTVVDIGCNDGTLLLKYPASYRRIGFDPSDAVQNIDPSSGIEVVNNYFSVANAAAAEKTIEPGSVDICTSISMFYDLDNPKDFVRDVAQMLAPDGVWVVEMNYTGFMLQNIGFDMISHEHVGYYTLSTFERTLEDCDLRVFHTTFHDINGGSLRLFIGRHEEQPSVAEVRSLEEREGWNTEAAYELFNQRMSSLRDTLMRYVDDAVAKKERLSVYGASTRGNTILQYCNFDSSSIQNAWERNPDKYGLCTPGSRIPIVSEAEGRETGADILLILAYGFIREFVQRERRFLENGGRMVVPVPEVKEIHSENMETYMES